MSVDHHCNGDFDLWFDGHRFSNLCNELSRLRLVSFVINLFLNDRFNKDNVSKFTRTFCTPFWLHGPLGCVRVCVGLHSDHNCIQMYSLPYTFPGHTVCQTIDLIDIQFNTEEDQKKMQIDLSVALKPLWSNMIQLQLSFVKKQHIPLSFLRALQNSDSKGSE